MKTHTILYVADQKKSCAFYKAVLRMEPQLDVPGMTEFHLSESHILGLMPEAGIKRLLGEKLPGLAKGARAELYLRVDQPEAYFERSIALGAKELSPILARDWGDHAGYVMDFDGHVLAFAKESDRGAKT